MTTSLNMMVIDGASYNELQSTLSLPAASEDEVKNYFIKCCNDAIGYGYPTLSDKAYGIIYNEQVDAGDSIKSMITDLGRILTSYHEDEPKHILSNAYLYKRRYESDKRSDDEFLAAAISSIARERLSELSCRLYEWRCTGNPLQRRLRMASYLENNGWSAYFANHSTQLHT